MKDAITVEATIDAPIEEVWNNFNDPEAVKEWNAPSPDWHCPKAVNDLKVGGQFNYRMEAKDGSAGFDFSGRYTEITPHESLAYVMDDGRHVEVSFSKTDAGTLIKTVFDTESENPVEMQRDGWQAILDNFKKYCERNK